jgi:hypothetical protein
MSLTPAQAEQFDRYARNPETWVFAARRNLAVTRLLMRHYDELRAVATRDMFESSGCYYASFFHAGLAIENASKAVLISRDPMIVSNGWLDTRKFGRQSGHALLNPVQLILGATSDEETSLLAKLESFVWAGRYSVPRKGDELFDREIMNNVRLSYPHEVDLIESLVERILALLPTHADVA